jgi:hypothetical protein
MTGATVPERDHPQGVWLAPEENPFGIRVLDCRAFSRSMISLSSDLGPTLKFGELRRTGGSHLRGATPANARRVAYPLCYAPSKRLAAPKDGPLFHAATTEDKWDIVLDGEWLVFARSWTGETVYRAGVQFTKDEMKVSPIELDGNEITDPEFAVRQVDFLIKSHLLDAEVPHPLPPGFPDDTDRILIYSFKQYGRHAAYATFADTLHLGNRKRFDPDATLPI